MLRLLKQLTSAWMESVLDDIRFEKKYVMSMLLKAQDGPLKRYIL